MRKNSLVPNKGLSLSQAQSISNLCNQRAIEIGNTVNLVNNYTKSVRVGGDEHITVKGRQLPTNIVELLTEKAELHACQAFLRENMKAKEDLLQDAKRSQADLSGIKLPEDWEYFEPKLVSQISEDWGVEQLTLAEVNEMLEAEAYAAHIGQFIHENKPLDVLRKELPTLPSVEWMVIEDGKKSPVKIKTHHTSEQLLELHEKLAGIHRGYEQRVNYFKAKIKNLVTEENARIAKLNADAQNEAEKINKDRQSVYQVEFAKSTEEIKTKKTEFEKERQAKIKEIASMRIDVDQRFQKVVNTFLPKVATE